MFTRDSKILRRELTVPITSISRAIGDVFDSAFNKLIQSLFANNEQGFFYDPNDMGTMFRDSAGTIPVTGAGQAVGLIRDKSGRGNHARQTNSASRPILRQNAITGAYYLEFDGSDDFFVTNSIDFTGTDKVSLFAGVRKLSDAGTGILCELSSSSDSIVNKGSFTLGAPYAHTGYGFQTLGTGSRGGVRTNGSAPTTDVISGLLNLAATSPLVAIRPKRNGQYEFLAFGGTDGVGGNFGNYPLYIGRRGGIVNSFYGHIYGLIGIGKLTSDDETAAIEKELAKRTGVTLNV